MDIHPVFKPKKEAKSEYSFPKITLLLLTLSLIISLVAFYWYYRKTTYRLINDSLMYNKEIDSLKMQLKEISKENIKNSMGLTAERKKTIKLQKEIKERDSIIQYWLMNENK